MMEPNGLKLAAVCTFSLKKGLREALSGCDMAKYGSYETRGRVTDLLL